MKNFNNIFFWGSLFTLRSDFMARSNMDSLISACWSRTVLIEDAFWRRTERIFPILTAIAPTVLSELLDYRVWLEFVCPLQDNLISTIDLFPSQWIMQKLIKYITLLGWNRCNKISGMPHLIFQGLFIRKKCLNFEDWIINGRHSH